MRRLCVKEKPFCWFMFENTVVVDGIVPYTGVKSKCRLRSTSPEVGGMIHTLVNSSSGKLVDSCKLLLKSSAARLYMFDRSGSGPVNELNCNVSDVMERS